VGHGAAAFDRVAFALEFYDGEVEILPRFVAGGEVVLEEALGLLGLALFSGGEGGVEGGELVKAGGLGGGEPLGEKAQVLNLPVFVEHTGAALTESQGRVRAGLGIALELVGRGAQRSVCSVDVEFDSACLSTAIIGHGEVLPLAG